MSGSPINVALLGHGYWGPNLARNIANNESLNLAAICDSNTNVRDAAAQKWGCRGVASYDDLLADDSIDAVVIASPSGMHFEHSLAALNANKHVLVEKPMATENAHAKTLNETAEQAGLVLMVGHTFMFNNIVHDIKERIDRGELGEIYYIYSQRLNLGRFRDDTDVIWTLAPHDITIADYWLGERPVRVQANAINCAHKHSNVDEVAFVSMEYPGGKMVHLHLSWLDPLKARKMVVIGSNKMLVYDDMASGQHIQIFDKGVDIKPPSLGGEMSEFLSILRSGDVAIPNIRLEEPLAEEIDHFAHCIKEGQRPRTDGRHGADVISVLVAMERAKEERGWVDVE